MRDKRMVIEVNRENLQSLYQDITILEERVKAEFDGLKNKINVLLQSSGDMKQVQVYVIRLYAILEEVYRKDGIVTAEELSEFARKWGKDPRGNAGYFTGNNASLKGISNGRRALTEEGQKVVLNTRDEYGADWLDRVDLEYVGNPNTATDSVILL